MHTLVLHTCTTQPFSDASLDGYSDGDVDNAVRDGKCAGPGRGSYCTRCASLQHPNKQFYYMLGCPDA